MGLHSKAFGQDIWNVQFSQDDPRRLTTSGIGHIRFWKMAATFTGLKLQGYIGKFGKIDLSDIENFVELPDGKVVSGTEVGALLLWEGNFIKCRFVQVGGKSCHNETVTYLSFDRSERCIISASLDGTIKWWDFNAIDTAEVDSDNTMDFELLPLAEYRTKTGNGIKSMVDGGFSNGKRVFVIFDTKGRAETLTFAALTGVADDDESPSKRKAQMRLVQTINRYNESLQEKEADPDDEMHVAEDKKGENDCAIETNVFNAFHASNITGMDTSPRGSLVGTCGKDGMVQIINYEKRKVTVKRTFQTAATFLLWIPPSVDPSGNSILVGFADGTVRLLVISTSDDGILFLKRKMVIKPHNGYITCMRFSRDGEYIATSGGDGTVFFLRCRAFDAALEEKVVWDPLRFVNIGDMNGPGGIVKGAGAVYCTNVDWSPTNTHVLLSCSDKFLREVDVSEVFETVTTGDDKEVLTYEISLPFRTVNPCVDVTTAKGGLMKVVRKVEVVVEQKSPEEGGSEGGAAVAASTTTGGESPAPPSPSKTSKAAKDVEEVTKLTFKMGCAVYALHRSAAGYVGGASMNAAQHMLCEVSKEDPNEFKDLLLGLYSPEGKDFPKIPEVRRVQYSFSQRLVAIAYSDGTLQVRPSEYLEVFAVGKAHNIAAAGTSIAAISHDDRYVMSVGDDGCLVIHRLRLDLVKSRGPSLFADIDAGVFGSDLAKKPPIGKIVDDEPAYLSFASSIAETDEIVDLFGSEAASSLGAPLNASQSAPVVPKEIAPIDDAVDLAPNAYSIQDNRLKLEEDAKKAAADELKSRIKASVRALRKDYDKIVKENELVPESVRLTKDELTIDNVFFAHLRQIGEEMREEVHRECAYQSEVSEKRLSKIQQRLMKGFLMDEISLAVFDISEFYRVNGRSSNSGDRSTKSQVWSFRAVSLDPSIERIIEQVKTELRMQELRESQQRSNDLAHKRALDAMEDMKQRLKTKEDQVKQEGSQVQNEKSVVQPEKSMASTAGGSGGGADEELSAARLRLHKRKERKEVLSKHILAKPSEHDDDERDIKAIKLAEKTIGDYKLKCADDYEVPEDQRINAVKKLRQMAMLEESMLMLRMKFNERFLSLRNLKKEIVFSIRRNNQRIRQIDSELEQSHLSAQLWQPTIDPAEFPDDFEEVTQQELEEYKKESANVPWEKSRPVAQRIATGNKLEMGVNKKTSNLQILRKNKPLIPIENDRTQLDNFLSDEAIIDYTPPRIDAPKHFEVNESLLASATMEFAGIAEQRQLLSIEQNVPALSFARSLINTRMQLAAPTPIQAKLSEKRRQALLFERTMTLKSIESNITSFREAVDELRVDRHRVTSDLKLAEFKLLSLYQEYKLLQTFEGRDNALHQKQLRCKGEESEIVTLSYDNKLRLEAKTEEIQTWNEKLAQITSEFKAMLPENHPYLETLTKIFRKKIKRAKAGGDNENEDEEEEDLDDEDDDEEDDEEVDDICPPGCDQVLFEKILELREKKLDTEEVSSDIQKSIDELKKTSDRLKAREKQIAKEAQQTEYEVQQFQLQKQAALNQIKVVVPMRIGQIYAFEQSGILTGPEDKPQDVDANRDESALAKLHDPFLRKLVPHITMSSHTLFSTRYATARSRTP